MHPTVCAAAATGDYPAALRDPLRPTGACGATLVPPLAALGAGGGPPAASLPAVCSPLFRLFCPLTLLEADRGWLVGWGLPDGTAVACSLLPPLPPNLVALFLQQLNERLLKSSAPHKPEQGTCSSSNNNSSSSCGDSSSSSSSSRSRSSSTGKEGDEGDIVFDYHVLPRPVELIGWWRGRDLKATCPFPQDEVLLLMQQLGQQQQRQQQQQQEEWDRSGFEAFHIAIWLDLWLEGASGLPVPLSVVSHAAAGANAAAPAAAAAAAGGTHIVRSSGADTAAGEGPPVPSTTPQQPLPAASRCVVFLYKLPSWVSTSTLAAAPHDAAQASAAAAFVQRPTAARRLLQQVARGIGAGGQQQQEKQQHQLQLQQRADESEQLCGFEAYLALLNVSAAVYSSIQQQLRCWRLLQLRQHTEKAAGGGATAGSAAATPATPAAGGAGTSQCSAASQQEQQEEGEEDLSESVPRACFSGCLSALRWLFCFLLLSLAQCVGVLCRGVCTLRLWRPLAAPGSNLWLSASLQQIVMRFRICGSWPGALRRKRRFAAALEDCSLREQQQQQQQAAAAAAAGKLQLGDTCVPALVSPHPRLPRRSLTGGLSVSALCLYTGIAAVVIDVLLGLFLPQLLAVLIYRGIPADACSPEYLSRLKNPPSEPTALPPLWPVSLSEAAAAQLYPFPTEQQEQQQQQQLEQQQLEAVQEAERSGTETEQQRLLLLQELGQPQQQQKEEDLSGVEVAGRSRKAQNGSRELSCSAAADTPSGACPASGGGAAGGGAAGEARAVAAVSRSAPPAWRELMAEPTSTLLLRLFSGCYCFLHVDLLTAHVQWLMDFPAGLKLNANLTWVLGSVVLTASHLWNDLTAYIHSAVVTAEQRKQGLLLQLQQLQQQLHQQQPHHHHSQHKPPGLLHSLNQIGAAVSHILRSLLWQQESEHPAAPTNPNTLAASQPPLLAPNSNSNSSSSGSSGSRGLWGAFVRIWSACHLWLKTGLGSLLMTFRLGWLGLSASLFAAASADLLMVGTLHIFYVYLVCARLLHVNLKSLHSLFLLFRGQKWNVLRRRVDSADLQMDQLLIGCILFTITVCLFPTTLVFYISYLLLWLLVFGSHALLRLAVCLFLAYPTCLLAFRAAAPHLLPAGVSFEPLTALNKQSSSSSNNNSSSSRWNSSNNSSNWNSCSSNNARCKLLHSDKLDTCPQTPTDAPATASPGTDPAAASAAAAAAAAVSTPRSSDNIYFMLRAHPISYGDIIWPPVFAAARNTLTSLHPSSLVPKILQGDIIRLSSHNSAWPLADG